VARPENTFASVIYTYDGDMISVSNDRHYLITRKKRQSQSYDLFDLYTGEILPSPVQIIMFKEDDTLEAVAAGHVLKPTFG
jgi:hypothetical protein